MKTTTSIIEEIAKISLFSELTQNDLMSLLEAAHEKNLNRGEFFYHQGDPAESMFVLIEGRAKLSQASHEGKQVLLHVVKPFYLFGMVAMTSANDYPVTAQAATDSFAVYWTRHELMGFVRKVPQMAINAMRIMADQLQEIQDRFSEVTTQKVEQRLANTLIRLAAQSGKKVDEGILIDLTITRKDLAEMSGTTLFTASRMLSQWDGQELIIAGREKVIICNPHGLAKIIEGV